MAVKVLEEKDLKTPEELIIVKPIMVREHGQTKAVGKDPGEKVLVSGLDKAELLARGIAVKPEDYKPAVKGKKGGEQN